MKITVADAPLHYDPKKTWGHLRLARYLTHLGWLSVVSIFVVSNSFDLPQWWTMVKLLSLPLLVPLLFAAPAYASWFSCPGCGKRFFSKLHDVNVYTVSSAERVNGRHWFGGACIHCGLKLYAAPAETEKIRAKLRETSPKSAR